VFSLCYCDSSKLCYVTLFCSEVETVIELENPGGPLGIHVMPSSDDSRRLVTFSFYSDKNIHISITQLLVTAGILRLLYFHQFVWIL